MNVAIANHILLLCVCSTTLGYIEPDYDDEPKLNIHKGQACEKYSSNAKRLSSDIWQLHWNDSLCDSASNDVQAMVLNMEISPNTTKGRSVIFAVESDELLQSWQLPFKPEYDDDNNHTSVYQYSSRRTICQLPSSNNDSYNNDLLLNIFTGSKEDVEYSIEIEPARNFILNLTNSVTFNVSFPEPQLYYFQFPDNVDSVIVEANTNYKTTTKCAIVSIQKASCPVNDQLDNARSKGMFQTMSSSASIVVTVDSMGGDRDFFIVVIAASSEICQKGNHYDVTGMSAEDSGPHEVILTVKKLEPIGRYVVAMVVPVIVFIGFGVVTCIVLLPICPCFNEWILPCCCPKKGGRCKSFPDETDCTPLSGVSKTQQQVDPKTQPQTNETTSLLADVGESKPVEQPVPPETKLVLSDTFKENHDVLAGKYRQYGWITVIVGIYYALPTFQLVYSESMILQSSGNQDSCYYNFKCPHPINLFGFKVNSFNNIFSNIGYLIMGVSFLIIVGARSAVYRKTFRCFIASKKERNEQNEKILRCCIASKEEGDEKAGVPQFFGIYYAMGFALVMEGFMSSFYHICPSNTNFQFDTAFMFIIGVLLIVKILQSRHPDISANAVVAFFCLAVVTILTLLGIWGWSKPYWETKLTLAILAIMGIIVFSISFYFFHDWSITKEKVKNWVESFYVPCDSIENVKKIFPKNKCRLFKIVFLVIADIVIAVGIRKEIIATIVLYLLIADFGLLLIFYFATKLWHRESFTLMPWSFFVLLIPAWILALYYFNMNVTSRESSPALSRNYNQHCYIGGFYDQHDVWHFLSALALFFSFMFLLTLDDGTRETEQKNLHAF